MATAVDYADFTLCRLTAELIRLILIVTADLVLQSVTFLSCCYRKLDHLLVAVEYTSRQVGRRVHRIR